MDELRHGGEDDNSHLRQKGGLYTPDGLKHVIEEWNAMRPSKQMTSPSIQIARGDAGCPSYPTTCCCPLRLCLPEPKKKTLTRARCVAAILEGGFVVP